MYSDETQDKLHDIQKWLELPKYIAELEESKRTYSERYYDSHSMYSRTVFDSYEGVTTQSPKVEEVVCNLVDAQAKLQERIDSNCMRYALFKPYSDCLSGNRLTLDEIDRLTQAIQEIGVIASTKDLKVRQERKTRFIKKENAKMNEKLADYKDAYEGLAELVRSGDSKMLKETVDALDKAMKVNAQYKEVKPLTKQEIMATPDGNKRRKMIADNIHLFGVKEGVK